VRRGSIVFATVDDPKRKMERKKKEKAPKINFIAGTSKVIGK